MDVAYELTIIGVGNTLMSDDGVGPRLIERLADDGRLVGDGRVELIDGGAGGLRMINWIEQACRLLFVDAARFGGQPGEARLLSADEFLHTARPAKFSLHEADVASVLRLTEEYFRRPPTWMLAIQVQRVGIGQQLSPALESRMDALADEVVRVAGELLEKPAGDT